MTVLQRLARRPVAGAVLAILVPVLSACGIGPRQIAPWSKKEASAIARTVLGYDAPQGASPLWYRDPESSMERTIRINGKEFRIAYTAAVFAIPKEDTGVLQLFGCVAVNDSSLREANEQVEFRPGLMASDGRATVETSGILPPVDLGKGPLVCTDPLQGEEDMRAVRMSLAVVVESEPHQKLPLGQFSTMTVAGGPWAVPVTLAQAEAAVGRDLTRG